MNRTGLRRRGGIEENAGDPLDGLVNLFDLGLVLAVAFLLAGLTFALESKETRVERRPPARTRVLSQPSHAPRSRGRGRPVGTVYRLADGRLVVVSPR